MRTCQSCGATLAESSQYCMQCGTPVDAPPTPEGTPAKAPDTTAFLGPAVLSGSVMGLLASIPLVNCLCCAWFLGGGGLAAWMVGRKLPGGARALGFGDGAFAGVLAGVSGALVATLLSIPLGMLSAASMAEAQAQMESVFRDNPEIPDWVGELMANLLSQEFSLLGVLIGLFLNLLVYGVFAMIGGILLVAIVRKPQT